MINKKSKKRNPLIQKRKLSLHKNKQDHLVDIGMINNSTSKVITAWKNIYDTTWENWRQNVSQHQTGEWSVRRWLEHNCVPLWRSTIWKNSFSDHVMVDECLCEGYHVGCVCVPHWNNFGHGHHCWEVPRLSQQQFPSFFCHKTNKQSANKQTNKAQTNHPLHWHQKMNSNAQTDLRFNLAQFCNCFGWFWTMWIFAIGEVACPVIHQSNPNPRFSKHVFTMCQQVQKKKNSSNLWKKNWS